MKAKKAEHQTTPYPHLQKLSRPTTSSAFLYAPQPEQPHNKPKLAPKFAFFQKPPRRANDQANSGNRLAQSQKTPKPEAIRRPDRSPVSGTALWKDENQEQTGSLFVRCGQDVSKGRISGVSIKSQSSFGQNTSQSYNRSLKNLPGKAKRARRTGRKWTKRSPRTGELKRNMPKLTTQFARESDRQKKEFVNGLKGNGRENNIYRKPIMKLVQREGDLRPKMKGFSRKRMRSPNNTDSPHVMVKSNRFRDIDNSENSSYQARSYYMGEQQRHSTQNSYLNRGEFSRLGGLRESGNPHYTSLVSEPNLNFGNQLLAKTDARTSANVSDGFHIALSAQSEAFSEATHQSSHVASLQRVKIFDPKSKHFKPKRHINFSSKLRSLSKSKLANRKPKTANFMVRGRKKREGTIVETKDLGKRRTSKSHANRDQNPKFPKQNSRIKGFKDKKQANNEKNIHNLAPNRNLRLALGSNTRWREAASERLVETYCSNKYGNLKQANNHHKKNNKMLKQRLKTFSKGVSGRGTRSHRTIIHGNSNSPNQKKKKTRKHAETEQKNQNSRIGKGKSKFESLKKEKRNLKKQTVLGDRQVCPDYGLPVPSGDWSLASSESHPFHHYQNHDLLIHRQSRDIKQTHSMGGQRLNVVSINPKEPNTRQTKESGSMQVSHNGCINLYSQKTDKQSSTKALGARLISGKKGSRLLGKLSR